MEKLLERFRKLFDGYVLKRMSKNFKTIVGELKDGDSPNFVFHLQGGGSSYQRRKQKRLIMRNIIANFYK